MGQSLTALSLFLAYPLLREIWNQSFIWLDAYVFGYICQSLLKLLQTLLEVIVLLLVDKVALVTYVVFLFRTASYTLIFLLLFVAFLNISIVIFGQFHRI